VVQFLGPITLAIFAAVFLAWWEGSKAHRQDARQIAAIRTLLTMEIDANVSQLRSFLDKQEDWEFLERLATRSLNTEFSVKNALQEQLELFSKAFESNEVIEINLFYTHLVQLVQRQDESLGLLAGLRQGIAMEDLMSLQDIEQRLDSASVAAVELLTFFKGEFESTCYRGEQLLEKL
jgi:hypothetical protein